MRTLELMTGQQRAWATSKGIAIDGNGYTASLQDNLFAYPMLPETKDSFASGKGKELGEEGKPGKMQALHSSSALVVNFFEYWQKHGVSNIAQACGAPPGMTSMRFERTYPTPLGGIPPHLDIEFKGTSKMRPLAVEAKFTEPYHLKTKRTIRDRYITHEGLWTQLPGCERLIRRIRKEEGSKTSFSFLDAPQLLKHILGLTTKFGVKGFELLYLWYEFPSFEADKHVEEIQEFRNSVKEEVLFRDMTYLDVYWAVRKTAGVDEKYTSYLRERYFPETVFALKAGTARYEHLGDLEIKHGIGVKNLRPVKN